MKSNKLYIYKASAGSGKTFTLAVEYIKLLVSYPKAYKHTLAVTFTNKATGEMKERILSQLYGIAHSLESSQGYYNEIKKAFPGMQESELRNRAQTALHCILNDYGHFRIQTIDAFFQTMLRSLSKELELSSDIDITLDSTKLLNETVDLLIKRLTPTSEEMGWLVEYIEEKLEGDKSWKINKLIKDFSANIIKEEYLERGSELRKEIDENNGTTLIEYRNQLNKIKKSIESDIKELGDKFFKIAESHSLQAEDFAGKTRGGIWGHFEKMQKGELPEIKANSNMQKCIDAPSKISKSLGAEECENIKELLISSKEIYENKRHILNSCNLSLQRFHQLRLLNNIAATLNEENNKENRFLLAQTTYLLSRMIENDTSFIFEKIGTEINHIFIDEFQDTSKLQWSCFKVLLQEVMSRGTFNLIVGDVKQSIYRWRNSDWNILNNIEKEFKNGNMAYYATGKGTDKRTTNFRSLHNIIKFNNALFKQMANAIANNFKEQLGNSINDLTKAYEDVEQQIPDNKEAAGYSEIAFVEKGDEGQQAAIIEYLRKTLHILFDEKKVKPSDVTILVRWRKEIEAIVEMFNNEFPHYGITSDDAYRLSSSTALKIIISVLRYICSPNDKVNEMELITLYHKYVHNKEVSFTQLMESCKKSEYLPQPFLNALPKFKELPIYELIENIIEIFSIGDIQGQDDYIYSFIDYASQYINNNICDLQDFIKAWDDEISEKSISTISDDSVKIVTIHKSKGLEFHTVIVPFCAWDFTGRAGDIIWCKPRIEPFNGLSLLPINRSKLMLESIYDEEYNRELLFQLVDNLNLMYVACTRASHNLFIFSDSKPKANSAGYYLREIMDTFTLEGLHCNKENTKYSYGDIVTSNTTNNDNEETKKSDKKQQNPFLDKATKISQRFVTYNNRLTSRQSHDLAHFLAQGDEDSVQQEYRAIGNLMHELMSKLSTGKELQSQLTRMQMDGLISDNKEKEKIRKLIEKAFSNPKAEKWFSGCYRLFNEHTILHREIDRTGRKKTTTEKQNSRPDRVMVSENETIVVDFKFGNYNSEHEEQIKDYIYLLSKIGYRNVKGFLWYVYKNYIMEVKL